MGHDIICLSVKALDQAALENIEEAGIPKCFWVKVMAWKPGHLREVMYPGLDTHAPEPSQSQIKEPFN